MTANEATDRGWRGDAAARSEGAAGTVLVVCATFRDHRELPRLGTQGLNYVFHDYASTSLEELICGVAEGYPSDADPIAEIERILAQIGSSKIAAIVSTDDYPGSALAAVLAKELGLPGVEPRVNLFCQQKYLARIEQRRLVPEAVPAFAAVDVSEDAALPDASLFPAFVKPVKSFFSIGAQEISSPDEIVALKSRWNRLDDFFRPLDTMLKRYAGIDVGRVRLIAEGLLKGRQVTVEGYAFGGKVNILGVVDSIFYPDTLAFSRFDYPSSLPDDVQARMVDIARRLMGGLGYDNGLFNIEMIYDEAEDRVSIIEINPRMASQFADLYEKVDGTNAYEVLLDIARGIAPSPKHRAGRSAFAASCVLRTFEDYVVTAVPTQDEIVRLDASYPGVRVEVHAIPGRRLSDELQDGGSYRYGIVNLGGEDLTDVLRQFEECKPRLGIGLLPLCADEGLPQALGGVARMG